MNGYNSSYVLSPPGSARDIQPLILQRYQIWRESHFKHTKSADENDLLGLTYFFLKKAKNFLPSQHSIAFCVETLLNRLSILYILFINNAAKEKEIEEDESEEEIARSSKKPLFGERPFSKFYFHWLLFTIHRLFGGRALNS